MVTTVEVNGAVLDLLIDARWLAEADAASSEKIGRAISWGLGVLAEKRALR
jgi:hypothetical protein